MGFFSTVGALTFKNSAYNFRPWELTTMEVPDYLDDRSSLTFHLRGTSLVKVTSNQWLRDRVRFSYDGYRRQRLIQPLVNQQPVPWSVALACWWEQVYNQQLTLKIDLTQPFASWLYLLLLRLSFVVTQSFNIYSIDCNVKCSVYHGSFGLESCRSALLVLPVQLTYEELKVLPTISFTSGFQAFTFLISQLLSLVSVSVLPFNYSNSLTYQGCQLLTSSFQLRTACFQVSPVQRFLVG